MKTRKRTAKKTVFQDRTGLYEEPAKPSKTPSVTVQSTITLVIQGQTFKLTMDELKALHEAAGKALGAQSHKSPFPSHDEAVVDIIERALKERERASTPPWRPINPVAPIPTYQPYKIDNPFPAPTGAPQVWCSGDTKARSWEELQHQLNILTGIDR